MTAPRRPLAWLWAAVWLRWRLTRVKAVRLFGRRRVGAAGPDYHLAPIETPVEGLDYDPDELPAGLIAKLELTRVELLGSAALRARPATSPRARRRRVASLAVVAILGVGAVGAGAAALVTGSTGVPAVDRLLGIYESELDEPARSGSAIGLPESLQPRADEASVSIEAGGDGSPRLVSSSYIARGGEVCTALTGVEGAVSGPIGTVTCVSPSRLAGRLERRSGVISAVNADDDHAVVRGFVSTDVASLSVRGPNGDALDVHLEIWRSRIPGVGSLKPFVALGDVAPPGSGRGTTGSDPLRFLNSAEYTFRAVMSDGKQVRILP